LTRRSSSDRLEPIKPFVVLPFSGLPYQADDLEQARAWVAKLEEGELSQADLVSAWDAPNAPDGVRVSSEWLDGGFLTRPGPVREGSPGVVVILESDAADVRGGRRRPVEVAIPMPPPPTRVGLWRSWPLVRYY